MLTRTLKQMGLLGDADQKNIAVSKFLNRLLGVEVGLQVLHTVDCIQQLQMA